MEDSKNANLLLQRTSIGIVSPEDSIVSYFCICTVFSSNLLKKFYHIVVIDESVKIFVRLHKQCCVEMTLSSTKLAANVKYFGIVQNDKRFVLWD